MWFNSSDFTNFRIGGGATATALSPIILALTIITIVLIFLLPRRLVIVPLTFLSIMAPFGQQIYIGGAHLYIARILTLVGWGRVALRDRSSDTSIFAGGFSAIDKIYVAWAFCRMLATCLLFPQIGAIVNQVGFIIDGIGGYLLLRVLIRNEDEIAVTIRILSVVVCVVAAGMIVEIVRGENIFGYVGGQAIPELRAGRIRAQGPFAHAIRAGTFGATLLCMNLWLWRSGKSPWLGILGVVGSVIATFTSASSTPLMAFAASIFAICFWPVRRWMQMIRRGIVVFLIGLQLVMKAPVWWVINHIDVIGGNSAYHRTMIVDQFIRHFSDWWLIGIKSAASWGWDMWDSANQFVAEGESGGLATFICFITLLVVLFRRIGKARAAIEGDRRREWQFWFLGCTVFTFIVSFFGISFSDQAEFGWHAFLAISVVATASLGQRRLNFEKAAISCDTPHEELWLSLPQDSAQWAYYAPPERFPGGAELPAHSYWYGNIQ